MPITRAMLKEIGLEPGKDVEFIAVGGTATAAQALNDKQIDALNVFDTINAAIQASATPLRQLPIGPKYSSLFSNGYIAHDDTIKTKGKQLAGFGRAWTKSVVACNANLEACVQSFWRAYPNQKPADVQKELPVQKSILQARLDKLIPPGSADASKFGAYSEDVWRDFIKLLNEGGQIGTSDIKVETLFTNEFVDEFNAFDAAALIAKARAIK
jgi:NitT/TauT family transport system substrate-binding protein